MPDITNQRYEILYKFGEKDYEPFRDSCIEHLNNLLDIVNHHDEHLEGSVYFSHVCENPTISDIDAERISTRQNLALFSMANDRIMEIGFNAGFSSLLLLVSNPNLKLVSIDICEHQYTIECAEYLKNAFGDRFTFIPGDSRKILPSYLSTDNQFDGFHIDGSHSPDIAETDLRNIISGGKEGSIICFDDSWYNLLRTIITLYLLNGTVSHVYDPNYHLCSNDQMFLRIESPKIRY